jgi:hypothetical protein
MDSILLPSIGDAPLFAGTIAALAKAKLVKRGESLFEGKR